MQIALRPYFNHYRGLREPEDAKPIEGSDSRVAGIELGQRLLARQQPPTHSEGYEEKQKANVEQ